MKKMLIYFIILVGMHEPSYRVSELHIASRVLLGSSECY